VFAQLSARLESLSEDAREWCDGRSPWLRAALTGYLAYGGVRHIADSNYETWFAGITLVFHEMGHIVFMPFGRTMTVLGGSLMQLLVPSAASAHLLLRQRDWFGLTVGLSWLSFSVWGLATYVADANKESLALVSLGGGVPEHDWSTLLTQWHVLNSCDTYAFALRVCAVLIWAFALALSLWLLRNMLRASTGA
jgi:hypothetical protein